MGHRRYFPPKLLPTALLVTAFLCTSAFADKRVALVVGNDRYPNLSADRQLQKAANDAQAVGEALTRLGFQVIRGTNLSRQGMIDKLSEFTAQLEPGDTAAFFYAGHGVAIGGVNYLVPSDVPSVTPDAEARVRGASLAEADVVAEIQNKGVRVALLVLDACRDNPFPRSGTRAVGNTRGLADAKPARGIFTIYSAGIGQTALDRLEPNDANRNSVFTRVFVEQLASPGVDLGGLAIEVRERVAELALKAKDDAGKSEPHEQTPAYYDQTIGGRVYLAGLPKPNDPPKPLSVQSGTTPAATPTDPAERAWSVTQSTTSQAVLEDFIRQFGETIYGSMARARLDELKKTQVEAMLSPPASQPPPALPPNTQSRSSGVPDIGTTPSSAKTACHEEKNARSVEGHRSAMISFRNDSPTPVRIYWVDYTGNRKFYKEIANGQRHDQPTYLTHPWVVTDLAGNCIGFYLPHVQPQEYVLR
jgi:hypothetical protein